MDEFTALVIGLIVGVTPSMLVLLLKVKKFDPESWKKDTTWQLYTQKLEVYGQLKTLLDAGRQRIKRQNSTNQNNEWTHVLIIPDDYESLKNIFGKYRYMLSDDLVGLYLELIKSDKYFSDIFSKEDRIEGHVSTSNSKKLTVNLKSRQTGILSCNLEDLEETATKEYDKLKRKHSEMIN